jgi:hypothetical protein
MFRLQRRYRMVDYTSETKNPDGLYEVAGERRYQPLRHMPPGITIQKGTRTMHVSDLNLAGLATLSFLVLFFPGVGLIEHRRRRAADRARGRAQKRELNKLVLEEAIRLLHEQQQREREAEQPARR